MWHHVVKLWFFPNFGRKMMTSAKFRQVFRTKFTTSEKNSLCWLKWGVIHAIWPKLSEVMQVFVVKLAKFQVFGLKMGKFSISYNFWTPYSIKIKLCHNVTNMKVSNYGKFEILMTSAKKFTAKSNFSRYFWKIAIFFADVSKNQGAP
jgi:hypothetical protein